MYRFYRYKPSRPYYDKDKIFYVCSFGGCGSQAICHYLGYFGDVYHIHSRRPPVRLTNTGYNDNKTYAEWFSDTIISDNEVKKYKVIFVYRDPVECIYSRFQDNQSHIKNIQCSNMSVTVSDCIREKKDLFELEEFFDLYTTKTARNYDIYCIKYETFWRNIETFNDAMGIPHIPFYYPEKKETVKDRSFYSELRQIYQPLINKMSKLKPIEIIKSA